MSTTTTTVVRYVVKPDRAEENAELVRAVYADLAQSKPNGFRYSTVLLDDGVTFIHTAINEGGQVPLTDLESFRSFQADIKDRCVEPPVVSKSELVGSYAPPEG
jgi:hypothetical protein